MIIELSHYLTRYRSDFDYVDNIVLRLHPTTSLNLLRLEGTINVESETVFCFILEIQSLVPSVNYQEVAVNNLCTLLDLLV